MAEPTTAQVGARLRRLRMSRRLSLRALAKMTDLSPSFISQLERGQTNASLPTLLRITGALDISIGRLLADESRLMRPERAIDRQPLTYDAYTEYVLTRRPSEHFEAFLGVLPPGACDSPADYSHGDSEELCYVIKGRVHYYMGDVCHVLEAGDSLEYLTSQPGHVENRGSETAELLWVIAPPTVGRDRPDNGRGRPKKG